MNKTFLQHKRMINFCGVVTVKDVLNANVAVNVIDGKCQRTSNLLASVLLLSLLDKTMKKLTRITVLFRNE